MNINKENKIKEFDVINNNYFTEANDKKENDKKIREIETEIIKKRKESIKRLELIQDSRNKELLKLEIKLLRKIYGDLFISFPNTFKQNNLTFENFVFEFGQKIHLLFELDKNNKNPSYDNILKEINLLRIKKYPITPDLTQFNKKELKKYFYELGINDDWSLIQRYLQEKDKLEEKQRLMKIAQSMKDYYNELNKQIEIKKNLTKKEKEEKEEEKKKKKIELEKIKLINKKKIEKLKENEKMIQMLDKKRMEQINQNEKLKQYYLQNLEEENDKLNENNFHLFKFKLNNAINIQTKQMQNYNQKYINYSQNNIINTGFSIPDEQISSIVDEIINKKREKNENNIFEIEKNENNMVIKDNYKNKKIEGIDYQIEKKVNKILEELKYKK